MPPVFTPWRGASAAISVTPWGGIWWARPWCRSNLADFQHRASALLDHAGLNPAALHHAGQALLNLLVNRQATMMAYNDVSWILGLLFLATVPMALLLPSRQSIARQQKMQGEY